MPTVLYTTTAVAAAGHVASGRVVVYSIRAISGSSTRRYVQLFDAVSVPDAGQIPRMVLQIEPNGLYEWHCQGTPRGFQLGLTWGFSTTGQVHTLADPECWLEMQYTVIA